MKSKELKEQIKSLEETHQWLKIQLFVPKYGNPLYASAMLLRAAEDLVAKIMGGIGWQNQCLSKAVLADYIKVYSDKFEEYLKQERRKHELRGHK